MSESWAPEEEARSSADRHVRPKDWPEVSEGGSKFKKFRFRVLSSVSKGWSGWAENDGKPKPVRAKTENGFPAGIRWQENKFNKGKLDAPKEAWCFVVLDVDADTEKVWELTQFSIMKAFRSVVSEWGNPSEYDLVCKQGKSKDGKVEYTLTVHPSGKTPLDPAKAARWHELLEAGFDIEKMWTGGDPFPKAAPAAHSDSGGTGSHGNDDLPF